MLLPNLNVQFNMGGEIEPEAGVATSVSLEL